VKACFITFLFLLPLAAEATRERLIGSGAVLNSQAATTAGKIRYSDRAKGGRGLASVAQNTNQELFERMKPGDKLIVQNSTYDMNDEVVTIIDKFEDGSVRLKRPNGHLVFVRAPNLAATLSPEVECGESHGSQICKGETVFYPVRSASLALPEDEVVHIFENRSVVVKDGGGQFILDLNQVGKRSQCSPQKDSICTGVYVHAEAYRGDTKFEFEGKVEATYSNGVALVRVGALQYPIEAVALKRRVEALDPNWNETSFISNRGSRTLQDVPYSVIEELEPLDPHGISEGRTPASLPDPVY